MEILSVALKNFKSHTDRHFVFEPGMNAICGENGAGKTSILEAIAWALFNHRGAYTTDDLIRNGAGSAQVAVEFVSSRDHRTYRIQRCTRAGYTIYDPQLGQKLDYTRIDDEVMPWLCDHFGLPRGTDLGRLFANTIGVPQGTFTADFLKTDKERRDTFDKILKLEEYRQAYQKMASLEKFAKTDAESVERAIARYDEELEGFDQLQARQQAQVQELQQAQAELQQTQTAIAQLQQELEQLTAQANQIQQLERDGEQLQLQIQAQTTYLQQLQVDLQQSETATAICTQHRPAFQAYQQAEQALTELEQQRKQERSLQQQLVKHNQQLAKHEAQLAALTSQQTRLAQAQSTLAELTPKIEQQTQLEIDLQAIREQLQAIAALKQTQHQQTIQLAQKQAQLQTLASKIAKTQALAKPIQQIPVLEQQQHRLQQQVSRIAAAQQFEADLHQLVQQAELTGQQQQTRSQHAIAILSEIQQTVPLWSDAVASVVQVIQQGGDWQAQVMQALRGILADLSEQIDPDKLKQQLHQIQKDLQVARQQQAEYANLEWLLDQQEELTTAIAELQTNLPLLQQQLATVPELEQQHTALTQQLATLDDPRGRCRLLQQELRQAEKLQSELETVQTIIATVQGAIAQVQAELVAFHDLDERVQAQQAIRVEHQVAYQEYLAYRELANTRKSKQLQIQEVTEQLEVLQNKYQQVKQEGDRCRQNFDVQQFQTLQLAYQNAKEKQIALNANLPTLQKLLAELDQQLARLAALKTERATAATQLKQQQKVTRFIKFARESYKKAGPRITERYVQRISWEADRLFRELLNRPNVNLEWTRDYEIVVREEAHTRRFVNLSGGEQMCAALAVRLALLKVLADLDVAFFDEPTTNMDKARRSHLADAIANIKSFRQLFVISHDDTFENLTGNVVIVQREV